MKRPDSTCGVVVRICGRGIQECCLVCSNKAQGNSVRQALANRLYDFVGLVRTPSGDHALRFVELAVPKKLLEMPLLVRLDLVAPLLGGFILVPLLLGLLLP